VKMEVSKNEFTPNLKQIPFYKSEMLQNMTTTAAVIDCCEGIYLSQSAKQDAHSLLKMYIDDLAYLKQFILDEKTHVFLALLAARSVLNLFTTDLKNRLRCLLRPTQEERNILIAPQSPKTPNQSRIDLLSRQSATISLLLDTEFAKLRILMQKLFVESKLFKAAVLESNDSDRPRPSFFENLLPGIFTRKEKLYKSIFRKPKAKEILPSMYVMSNNKRSYKRANDSVAGAVEPKKRQCSQERI
jgi:hypothetical protein